GIKDETVIRPIVYLLNKIAMGVIDRCSFGKACEPYDELIRQVIEGLLELIAVLVIDERDFCNTKLTHGGLAMFIHDGQRCDVSQVIIHISPLRIPQTVCLGSPISAEGHFLYRQSTLVIGISRPIASIRIRPRPVLMVGVALFADQPGMGTGGKTCIAHHS